LGVRRDAELLDERRTGFVSAFDDDRGLGTITGDDGAEIGFHCTAIADGTRTIETGAQVSYLTRARHLGRWEATDLRPA
jgi:cold shock CspA family protein